MSYEYTLLQKQNLILYQIPPLASAKGHYLDTWKDMIWNGNIKVISRDGNNIINFLNFDGSIFACCPVPHRWEEAIQKCVDSSRGFAVRLQNPNGKYAWVGLAFRDRNDAFDFNVCFSDFEQKRELEINPNKFAKDFENMQDFSIKEGQKLVLSFGDQKSDNKAGQKPKANLSEFKFSMPGQQAQGTGGGFMTQKQPEPAGYQANSSTTGFGFDQGFNSWGGAGGAPAKKNDFSDFGNFTFGGSQPPQKPAGQPQQQSKPPVKQSENLLDL